MSVTKKALEGIKALISKPENWTKHVGAADAKGLQVSAVSPEATKFCIWGAYCKVLHDQKLLGNHAAEAAVDKVFMSVAAERARTVSGFNDDHETTHADVIAFMDECITVSP